MRCQAFLLRLWSISGSMLSSIMSFNSHLSAFLRAVASSCALSCTVLPCWSAVGPESASSSAAGGQLSVDAFALFASLGVHRSLYYLDPAASTASSCPVRPSLCLFHRLCVSEYPSVYLYTCLCQSICSSVIIILLSVCLSVWLSVCLSVCMHYSVLVCMSM